VFADWAALMAEVAAEEAAFIAESVEGGVTTVVEVDGVVVVAGGVVVVVVVSSFLLQAANETAAARVTISNAVFMFLLDFGFGNYRSLGNPHARGAPSSEDKESPSISSA
jgi:hypothetical protein